MNIGRTRVCERNWVGVSSSFSRTYETHMGIARKTRPFSERVRRTAMLLYRSYITLCSARCSGFAQWTGLPLLLPLVLRIVPRVSRSFHSLDQDAGTSRDNA